MSPKAQRESQRGVPAGVDESSLTKENYERELRTLAAQARQQTTFRSAMRSVAVLVQVAQVLAIAAVYSNVSQLTLSPVYGAIPSALWHSRLVITACLLGWSGNLWLQRLLPKQPIYFLAPVAFYIPFVQYLLFQLSGYFGPIYGPAITELVTFVPLLLVSVSSIAIILEDLDLSFLPKSVADAAPGIGSFIFFRAIEHFSNSLIRDKIGTNLLTSRVGLQLVLGGLYARLAPSKLLLFALPALFHTAFLNPHARTPFATFDLNLRMEESIGFKVVARHDSVTGYLSVIENTRERYQVLRCDHSLLGGVWLPHGKAEISEPIYGVFAMLEAVRLVEVPASAEWAEKALVIGLGIGTTPSALIAHGIDTTIVEIDPVVRDYALKYFDLPENHTPVIADAVTYTASLAKTGDQKYDYIVHDVFTGGAEPVELFTVEFFENLRSILQPNGVITINYAGDLLLPSARLVVRTIKSVFPSCRIYRENASPDPSILASEKRDFTNMVIFCTNQKSPISFRKPVEADYLKSGARKAFLIPKHEIEQKFFEEQEGDGGVLNKNDTTRLTKWQETSALGHWHVMRTVLPSQVWEKW